MSEAVPDSVSNESTNKSKSVNGELKEASPVKHENGVNSAAVDKSHSENGVPVDSQVDFPDSTTASQEEDDGNPVVNGANVTPKTDEGKKDENIVSSQVGERDNAEVETNKETSPSKCPEKVVNVSSAAEKFPSKTGSPVKELDGNAKFLLGKRDYLIGDYPAAVTHLGEACELLTAKYGELADEMGDAYLFYGKALFANARSASGVLGDKIDKDTEPVEEDDEEGEEDDENEEKGDDNQNPNDEESAEKSEEATSTNADTQPETEEGAPEEDVDDLQLSWEMLEMAKVIFSKKADLDKNAAIKLSEVYLTLGENGLESESYTTAVADMQTCLDLQNKNLSSDDRRIAETLYQIGVAHSTAENYDEAVSLFKQSIVQLKKRLETLSRAKSAGLKCPEGENKDSFYTIDGETTDINDIIKEISEKITDMEDSKKHMKEQMTKKLAEGLASTSAEGAASTSSGVASSSSFSAPSSSSSSSKPVSNISHLVRKKRSNDDGAEDPATKKAKTEDT